MAKCLDGSMDLPGVVRANTISLYLQSADHWESFNVISSGPLRTMEVHFVSGAFSLMEVVEER